MRTYVIGLLPLAMLTSCNDANRDAGNEVTADRQTAPEFNAIPSDDGSVAAASASVPPSVTGTPSVADLPLEKGVYARLSRESGETPNCPPANAFAASFNGVGFGGRNSAGCRFNPTRKNGSTWSGTQTCTDTYTEEQRSEDWVITVNSPRRYTQQNQFGTASFELCPNEDLSDWGG